MTHRGPFQPPPSCDPVSWQRCPSRDMGTSAEERPRAPVRGCTGAGTGASGSPGVCEPRVSAQPERGDVDPHTGALTSALTPGPCVWARQAIVQQPGHVLPGTVSSDRPSLGFPVGSSTFGRCLEEEWGCCSALTAEQQCSGVGVWAVAVHRLPSPCQGSILGPGEDTQEGTNLHRTCC